MRKRNNFRLVPAVNSSVPFVISTDEVTIGSAPGNDLIVRDATVSRRHATLMRRDNRICLTDRGATNGTFVNGHRISAPVYLNDGDELRLGAVMFHFAAGAPTPRGSSRTIAVVVALALVFAAGLAGTMHLAGFDRGHEAGHSPLPSVTTSTTHATVAFEPGASRSTAPAPLASARPLMDEGHAPADDLWLGPLNQYRRSAGLGAVTADSRLSRGDYLHSRYIVKNYGERLAARDSLGPEMHFEDASKPWYSVEGEAAGRAGDVDEMWNPRGPASPSWALDNWMQSPFHRLPILNPHLHRVGYGYYCEGAVCIAALDLNSDADAVVSAPTPLTAPIRYPPNGSTIHLNSFDGEWPDPLTSCPGYSVPAGYPITLQLGTLADSGFASASFKRTAPAPTALEACAFDGNTYINPDAGTQKMIRHQLINFGAIVVIPRAPLTRGNYTVAIVAAGRDYSWSFSVDR